MILHCCQVDDVQTFRCHYGSSNQACPRENSCFSTVHRLPLRELEHQPPPPPLTARTHTHTRAYGWFASWACNIPSSTPSLPSFESPRNSSFFRVPRKSTARRVSLRFQVRRFPIFAHVFIRLTVRERGQSWSGEARINEPRKRLRPSSPFPSTSSFSLFKLHHQGFRIRYDCALRPHSMAGQEEQVMVFAAINVWLTKGNSRLYYATTGVAAHEVTRKVTRKKSFGRGIIEFSVFQRPADILLTSPLQLN